MKNNINKKAFTLVELLAVVVIIAVIALISTPIILSVIEDMQKGAFLSSVDGYIRAINNEYIINILNKENAIEEFAVLNGKVNGESILNSENNLYNGIININPVDGSYFVVISNGKYCAYKEYNQLKPELVDIQLCNIDYNEGIYNPVIEVSDENNLTLTKEITINFVNDKNNNQYCIGEYNEDSSIINCDNFITVNDSMIKFTIDKKATIHAKVYNDEKELITTKVIANIGEYVVDKTPKINSLTLTADINSIIATVTAQPYKENQIVKYYYSVDDGEYIESTEQYYEFINLEPYVEHLIKVYAEDNEGNISIITEDSLKTLYEDRNPEIRSFSTSNSETTITVDVSANAYGGSLIERYYYSIDDGEYIESENSFYTFENVSSFEEHEIKIYVKDNLNRLSNVEVLMEKTSKVHKIPTITSLTTTSGENDITVTSSVILYDDAVIEKYYYSIDGGEYIESTNNYYNFSDLTSHQDHTFRVYVVDSMGSQSNVVTIKALTNAAAPYLTIIVNNMGYEYNGELWYPYGTSITLSYSSDMTNKTGYYQTKNESSNVESPWTSHGTSNKKNVTLKESHTYRIKILNSDGTETEVVEKKINIMPNPTSTSGVPINYYTYNMGGIYPVYITNNASINSTLYGTDKYNNSQITRSAAHMGLIDYKGSSLTTAESKLLYIKLIPCPEEGYVESTKNGITSSSRPYNASTSYYGFVFVNEDGTEIKGPSLTDITSTESEDNISTTITAESYNGATIGKYYYSVDSGTYIESANNYYEFKDLQPYIPHTIKAYAKDSNGAVSQVIETTSSTTKAIPTPEIIINGQGYEYNRELWYPYGTTITLSYSSDMTNLTGYYQTVNESSKAESDWMSSGTSKTKTETLKESTTYRIKIADKIGRETEVVEKKINIMPNPTSTSGVPTNYYTYNMGGIYPVYITNNASINNTLYGTDKYNNINSSIGRSAAHMGLIDYKGSSWTTSESKLLYIKLIPCPEEGYVGSTRNGITSSSRPYNASTSYYGFVFINEDGTEIKGPSVTSLTSVQGENNIAVTITAESYNGATIGKYYYSVDGGEYIESTNNYYEFKDLQPYIPHTIKAYVKDSNGAVSQIMETTSSTTKTIPTPEIIINGQGYEYNRELWYPYGTTITLSYSSDMTNLTGYYQTVNESSKAESDWMSSGTSKTKTETLYESTTYRIKIADKIGRETEVVEKKINIMPNPTSINGIRKNYYTYNIGGIYPVYITNNASINNTLYGTDKYYNSNIAQAAAHMGLIDYKGSSWTTSESKLLYIKLIPCPEEGYVGSTRNGITSKKYSYNSNYNGFVFVNEDGTEIEGE